MDLGPAHVALLRAREILLKIHFHWSDIINIDSQKGKGKGVLKQTINGYFRSGACFLGV